MNTKQKQALFAAAALLFSQCPVLSAFGEDYYTDYGYSEEEYYYNEDSSDGYYYDDSGSYYDDSGSYGTYDTYDTYDTYSDYQENDYTEEESAVSEGSEESESEKAEDVVEIPPFDPENIVQGEIITNKIPDWPKGPSIECASAILIEDSTGTVLYSSDSDIMYYPSSPVKIMTCLLALENCDLSEEVTFTETGVSGATDGATNIAAQVDEVFTVEQCLYAIMLSSANDASLQIAEYVGGTVDFFVEMMNDKALSLGCNGTVFTNPTGLSDPAQHTTAHDLALIMQAAMKNETFRQIASANTYTIPPTNLSGGERNLTNTFTMTDPGSAGYYSGTLAGKEGYTSQSGSVLVCTAERDGISLTCAVMRGEAENTDAQAAALLDYGFFNFRLMDLGYRDFNVIDGGKVCVPIGTITSQVEMEDTLNENNEYSRQYTFGGNPVGTATALIVEEEEDPAIADGQKHMEEALENSQKQSIVPYIIIIAAGLLLIGFVITRIVAAAKKNS